MLFSLFTSIEMFARCFIILKRTISNYNWVSYEWSWECREVIFVIILLLWILIVNLNVMSTGVQQIVQSSNFLQKVCSLKGHNCSAAYNNLDFRYCALPRRSIIHYQNITFKSVSTFGYVLWYSIYVFINIFVLFLITYNNQMNYFCANNKLKVSYVLDLKAWLELFIFMMR